MDPARRHDAGEVVLGDRREVRTDDWIARARGSHAARAAWLPHRSTLPDAEVTVAMTLRSGSLLAGWTAQNTTKGARHEGSRAAMVIALGVLALMPGTVKGQMSAPGGREGGMDAERDGAGSSATPMMEQMQHTMRQMADALKTGAVTPEQQRRMGEVMGQMADIMASSPSAAPQTKPPMR